MYGNHTSGINILSIVNYQQEKAIGYQNEKQKGGSLDEEESEKWGIGYGTSQSRVRFTHQLFEKDREIATRAFSLR